MKIGEGTARSVCTCKCSSHVCFITFLARRSANHRSVQRVVNFKSLGKMIRDMRGYHAGQQRRAERPVTAANIEQTV